MKKLNSFENFSTSRISTSISKQIYGGKKVNSDCHSSMATKGGADSISQRTIDYEDGCIVTRTIYKDYPNK